MFNRLDLLARKEAVCVCYARRVSLPITVSVVYLAWMGFVDRNSFPLVVRARVTTCTYYPVWSSLDYVLCVHLIDFASPGKQAGSGRLGMDLLELELVWSSQTQTGGHWRRRGLGSKKKSGLETGATTHLAMQSGSWGVGQPSRHCERVVWVAPSLVPCRTVWQPASTLHKCGIACSRLVGSIGKGYGPLKRPGDRGSPKPKSCPWVAAWRQGQGVGLD